MKCVICQSDTKEKTHPKTKVAFDFCPQCGLISKHPDFFPNLEEERKKYLEHHNDWSQISYVEYLRDFMEKSVIPFVHKGDLLDYGFGHTPVLAQMAEREYEFSTKIYDKHFFPEPSVLEETYDVITATEVVEHLVDPHSFFSFAHEHLKENGILSIMTLFSPDENVFFDWWYIRDKTHIRFYQEKTFDLVLELHGFILLYTDHKRMIVLQKASN